MCCVFMVSLTNAIAVFGDGIVSKAKFPFSSSCVAIFLSFLYERVHAERP